MEILNPLFLWLMLPPLLLFFWILLHQKEPLERFFSPKALERLRLRRALFSPKIQRLCLFGSAICMLLALSRPILPLSSSTQETPKERLVILFDASLSMEANDLYPTRWLFAKERLVELLEEMGSSHEVAFIVFARHSFMLSPFTEELRTLGSLWRRFTPSSLPPPRESNLLLALESAYTLLQGSLTPSLVLLVSDGAEGELKEERSFIERHALPLMVYAIGTQEGGEFPFQGALIRTSLNPRLQTLASKGFIEASYDKSDLAHLRSLLSSPSKRISNPRTELFPYLLGAALGLLALGFIPLPMIRFSKILIILLALNLTTPSSALEHPKAKEAERLYLEESFLEAETLYRTILQESPSPEAQYNLANTLYRQNRFQEAITLYARIQTKNPDLLHALEHNQGNAHYHLKEYRLALEAYERALKHRDDPQTRHNLNLTLSHLKEERPLNPPSQKLLPLSITPSQSSSASPLPPPTLIPLLSPTPQENRSMERAIPW